MAQVTDSDVKVIISAIDNASAEFNRIKQQLQDVESSSQSTSNKMAAQWEKVKSHWIEIAAVIVTLKKAWDFAEQAAQFQEQAQALNNLAARYQSTADAMINAIQRAADGTISKMDAMSVANKGLISGLNPAQIEHFTEVAKRLSGALGTDMKGAFEGLIHAAGTGNERMLKQMGIVIDIQGAYQRYANSVNKMVDQLSEQEKVTVGVNAIMKKSDDIMQMLGPSTDSVKDSMERFTAKMQDMKLIAGQIVTIIGAGFVAILSVVGATVNGMIAWLAYFAEKVVASFSHLPLVGEYVKSFSDAIAALKENSKDAAWEGLENAKIALKAAASFFEQEKAIKGATNALKENTKEAIANIEQKQKLLEAELKIRTADTNRIAAKIKGEIEIELESYKYLYDQKFIGAHEYYGKKTELENDAFDLRREQIETEIDNEIILMQKKKELLKHQPWEVQLTAQAEYMSKVIGLNQQLTQADIDQTQNSMKNRQAELDDKRRILQESIQLQKEAEEQNNQVRINAEIAYQERLNQLRDNSPYNALSQLQEAARVNEIAAIANTYQQKLKMLRDYNDSVIIEMRNAGIAQEEIDRTRTELSIAYQQQEYYARVETVASMAGALSGMLMQLHQVVGERDRIAFYASKLLAVAQIILYTEVAAARATMEGGFFLGIPMAMAIRAMGYASAALVAGLAIASPPGSRPANPAFSGPTGAGSFAPLGGGSSALTSPSTEKKSPPPYNLTIIIQGNIIGQEEYVNNELIPAIEEAVRNERSNLAMK